MTIDTVPPPEPPKFPREYLYRTEAYSIRKRFPNFKLIQENSIESVMEMLCPELIMHTMAYTSLGSVENTLSKKSVRTFGTYLWIMKEYHSLWDL